MQVPIAMFLAGAAAVFIAAPVRAQWQPADPRLLTAWAKEVSPDNVHPEYPRPQMVRESWLNLNGLWEYAVRPRNDDWDRKADGRILVPFPIESALSGVNRRVSAAERLWYRRAFTLPDDWKGQRLLLNFEAVDWEARVWVNGHEVGGHRGGYSPFALDITAALRPQGGEQEIVVAVWDPTSDGDQPRGKQINNPHGIWYTPTTGIWATVWIEPAAMDGYIRSVKITPDYDGRAVSFEADVVGAPAGWDVQVAAREPGRETPVVTGSEKAGRAVTLVHPRFEPWTPDTPKLYDATVTLRHNGRVMDVVETYFGLRKIEVKADHEGINRLMLNNQALFQYGPLDQGFWPDGLYTAPTDAALRYDLEITKKYGFNMVRKHVKVEPRRWYYWCDKLGLLVWQDMPSGDRYIGPADPDIERIAQSAEQFETELKEVIDTLHNHPSIVMWVPFNEGWGQYDTPRITQWVKEYDPTRLVNNTSGWADRAVGDVHDVHVYPGPGMPPVEPTRAAVLGEFGGLGLPLEGHTWQDKENWGYQNFPDPKALTDAYVKLLFRMRPLIGQGLSAAVYTQTTDVEIEVNGLMTYDRAVLKIDPDRALEAARKLHLPPPRVQVVIPSARERAATWRYTTTQPAGEWFSPGFDDSAWQAGPGGFGKAGTPGAVIGTPWESEHLWLRREVEFSPDVDLENLHFLIHHDEEAEIHINGRKVARIEGYTTNYIMEPLSPEARAAIKPGQKNLIAVYCHNAFGGQFIDLGFVTLEETAP